MRGRKSTIFFVLILCFLTASVRVAGVWAANAGDQRKEVALRYYRGVVNFEAGRYDAALAEFQTVAVVDPYYKDVQQYTEKCVIRLEENLEALDRTQEGVGANKKEVDLYFLGKSYYEKGDYKRALETFKVVLTKNPNDKFALYYSKLCEDKLGGTRQARRLRLSPEEAKAARIGDLEKEVAYVKSDVKEQEDVELFLEKKAERKASRDELIHKKELQLQEQESLLDEERQDYLAEEKIAKRAQKVKKEAEKWKNMKDRLASDQPGVPAELTEFPVFLDKAENYYAAMKEALRTSRWNSAGLNAINTSIYYCDALLIYFYNIKSAVPKHENVGRLLLSNVKRADTEQALSHLHSILNLKKIIESDDRPITRNEAIFLGDHADKLIEWCKSILP